MCTHFHEYLNKKPVEIPYGLWCEIEKSFETVLIVGDMKCPEIIKIEEVVKAAGHDYMICIPEIVQDVLKMQSLNIGYIRYLNTKAFFDIKKERFIEELPLNDLKKRMLRGEIVLTM